MKMQENENRQETAFENPCVEVETLPCVIGDPFTVFGIEQDSEDAIYIRAQRLKGYRAQLQMAAESYFAAVKRLIDDNGKLPQGGRVIPDYLKTLEIPPYEKIADFLDSAAAK